MSLAKVISRAQLGMTAPLVSVEVHLSNGLPAFTIVGLPETAVKESKDRVRSAIINSSFEFPARKIIVNMAPADLRKEGGRYDLSIAIGILVASGQIAAGDLSSCEFVGELALSGEMRAVKGVLPSTIAANKSGRAIYVASGNAREAALTGHTEIYSADHLLQVTSQLHGVERLTPVEPVLPQVNHHRLDMIDIKGQALAKRALELAAAGRHNLLLIGPPGTGKTMLASRLPGLLPTLNKDESLEVAALYSMTGPGFRPEQWAVPPFRSPHHSASSVALVGGGSHPRPGEISLAHNGVLFLDELPEFGRNVLEQLREPMETGSVNISRAAQQVVYPARFQLVAAMNPCPCGWLGDTRGRCRCTEERVQKYRSKVSGPLLDRIDMHIEVPPLPREALHAGAEKGESSTAVRQRVMKARDRQLGRSGVLNQHLTGEQLQRLCRLNKDARHLLDTAMDKLGLSARAYHRILRVARTIADLEAEDDLSVTHVSEAVGYRVLDRTPND